MPPVTVPFAAMRSAVRFAQQLPRHTTFATQPASRSATFSTRTPSRLATFPRAPTLLSTLRFSSTSTSTSPSPRPLTDRPSPSTSSNSHKPSTRAPQPSYDLTFTCTPCTHRSTHRISKHGYHSGSVLITCPSCRNRHVISDHLGIFGDRKLTIEDLMRERGQLVKKGTLSDDGDLEFWEDGTTTQRGEEAGAPANEAEKGA